jgi:putative SOS response-associated peptidase YedK
MCGRYVVTVKAQQLALDFGAADQVGDYPADYNVAPTVQVPAVLVREGGRVLTTVRWGLVPFWAKDPSIGSKMFNARVETVAEKGAFKASYAKRRCLLPADGYYEWLKPNQDGHSQDGHSQGGQSRGEHSQAGLGATAPAAAESKSRKAKGRKQPFFIHAEDGGLLAFAGIYERWRDPEGAWIWSASILTAAAAPGPLARIHDRMPLTVPRAGWTAWLDPELTAPDEARGLLDFEPRWVLRPVADTVNSVRNNGAQLIDRVEPPPELTVSPTVSPGVSSAKSGTSGIAEPGTLF